MTFTTFTALLFIMLVSSKTFGLDIVSYNIRNFDKDVREGTDTNKPVLTATLKSLNADLFAIQEVVNQTAFAQMISTSLPEYGYAITACGGTGKQKLGFLYKKSTIQLNNFREDARLAAGGNCNKGLRPAAIGHFTYLPNGMTFTAVAVHLKAGGKQANADVRYRQYGIIAQILKEIRQQGQNNLVVLGDFNTTDYVLRNQNYARFMEFIDNNQLIDFSAEINCTAYWWGETDDNMEDPSILDHVIASQEFRSFFKGHTVQVKAHCEKVQCQIASSTDLGVTYKEVSDHCPMLTSLKE
ncbi:MAG: endonuclease/exonuclease/phosphatase family protein [Bdellovibrio sp.]|nr:endonuclease/exonuclease/phosphatase family protein [Bdellovibrio sp.]